MLSRMTWSVGIWMASLLVLESHGSTIRSCFPDTSSQDRDCGKSDFKAVKSNPDFGIQLKRDDFLDMEADYLKSQISKNGFIVVKGLNLTDDRYRCVMKHLGDLVTYKGKNEKVGWGYQDLLKFDNRRGKTLLGSNYLPLHVDGWLTQRQVDYLGLYGHEIKGLGKNGPTGIVNHPAALADMAKSNPKLLEIIENESFQVNAADPEYFQNASPKNWFTLPTLTDLGWVKKMIMFFPFPEGAPTSWQSRIRGYPKEKSDEIFKEIFDFFTQDKFYYRHIWSTGDLVILDNRAVLHCRENFPNDETVTRKVWSLQSAE